KAHSLASGPNREARSKLAGKAGRDEFENAAAVATKGNPGSPNVLALIEAVRAAFEKTLAEGLAFERQLFVKLKDDERSKALRYAFFAERKSAKIEGLPAETKTREVARAVVIGAGTMGSGIAACFINASIPVTVIEDNQDALSRGIERVK